MNSSFEPEDEDTISQYFIVDDRNRCFCITLGAIAQLCGVKKASVKN